MTVSKEDIRKNTFAALYNLRRLFLMQRDERGTGYVGVLPRGDFGLFDYNTGLLSVHVDVVAYGKGVLGNPDEEIDNVNYTVLFTVGCADDGLWQAWSKVMPKEKCEHMVERIKTEVLDEMTVLPSDKELNKILQPYGLFGEYQ